MYHILHVAQIYSKMLHAKYIPFLSLKKPIYVFYVVIVLWIQSARKPDISHIKLYFYDSLYLLAYATFRFYGII